MERFLNQYVWFEAGQVLGSDKSHEAFVLRDYQGGKPRPLFIRKVVKVEPEFIVRSPLRGCSVDEIGDLAIIGRDLLNL
jgi:hypothetical protein